MTFEELRDLLQSRETVQKVEFIGPAPSKGRVSMIKEVLAFLGSNDPCLTHPVYPDDPLQGQENQTIGMWVKDQLTELLTLYYEDKNGQLVPQPLSNQKIRALLNEVGVHIVEVIGLMRVARNAQVDRLLELGSLEQAFVRQ